jgi:hypothetical protein
MNTYECEMAQGPFNQSSCPVSCYISYHGTRAPLVSMEGKEFKFDGSVPWEAIDEPMNNREPALEMHAIQGQYIIEWEIC